MIELTEDQIRELAGSEPALVLNPQTCQRYVLVREELYDRMKAVLDDEGTIRVGNLVEETMREYDEGDPLLETYQKYRT